MGEEFKEKLSNEQTAKRIADKVLDEAASLQYRTKDFLTSTMIIKEALDAKDAEWSLLLGKAVLVERDVHALELEKLRSIRIKCTKHEHFDEDCKTCKYFLTDEWHILPTPAFKAMEAEVARLRQDELGKREVEIAKLQADLKEANEEVQKLRDISLELAADGEKIRADLKMAVDALTYYAEFFEGKSGSFRKEAMDTSREFFITNLPQTAQEVLSKLSVKK